MADKVVDASVLGAVAFGEPRADEAAALLDRAALHAPGLLAYEIASIARRKIVLAPSSRDLIVAALEDALALDLTWWEVDQAAVADLALALGITTYDASYLHLARRIGAELVTFDEALASAARARP